LHNPRHTHTKPVYLLLKFSKLFLQPGPAVGNSDLLTIEEVRTIKEAIRTGKAVDKTATRLCEVHDLNTGQSVYAALGLPTRMCVDSHFISGSSGAEGGIRQEIETLAKSLSPSEAKEIMDWLCYIMDGQCSEKEYDNGIRDKGRAGMRLSDFFDHPISKEAHLVQLEVLAMRIYSSHIFPFMNNPLRDDKRYDRREACPLPLTTLYAADGIRKLRAIYSKPMQRTRYPLTLWRGMRNRKVTESFLCEGGTEMAFMSTTTDLEVAVLYSLSQQSLLFKIVASNFLSTGADLQWLSVFPGEAEIVYPPLTFLEPTGRTQEVSEMRDGQLLHFTVIEVTPCLG
jgi:hypothetical protein